MILLLYMRVIVLFHIIIFLLHMGVMCYKYVCDYYIVWFPKVYML